MSRLQDRVAVITGAGRGIGREIALLMASQGAKIVVNDLGANTDGTGSTMIADDVVAEIKAAGEANQRCLLRFHFEFPSTHCRVGSLLLRVFRR